MFTREQIEEIKHKLDILYPPVKDSMMQKAHLPIHGEEQVVLVQNGKSVVCNLDEIFKRFKLENAADFINMESYGPYLVTTLEEAIAYIDPTDRRHGLIITFPNDDDEWETWQFNGGQHQWQDFNKWKRIDNYIDFSDDEYSVNITGANIKIEGVKIDGGSLYFKLRGEWIKTDLELTDLLNIEKENLDNHTGPDHDETTVPNCQVTRDAIDKAKQEVKDLLSAETVERTTSDYNLGNRISDVDARSQQRDSSLQSMIMADRMYISRLEGNETIVKEYSDWYFDVENMPAEGEDAVEGETSEFFAMVNKYGYNALVIPANKEMTVHYTDVDPTYIGDDKAENVVVMHFPTSISIKAKIVDGEPQYRNGSDEEWEKLHTYASFFGLVDPEPTSALFPTMKFYKVPSGLVNDKFTVIYWKDKDYKDMKPFEV